MKLFKTKPDDAPGLLFSLSCYSAGIYDTENYIF